ncbi:Snakin-2 [Heracleum sosnowskyi]|uniref:Snakin-2 n=1 Tax=Heracleum sosnowskyi TaxID=360622 RepID=A0AAD8IBG7_9APIA|nr:Snakin-2 [Heracleum sosnowskyi]
MALKPFLLLALLFFCALQVSSYSEINDDEQDQLALQVVKGANRRLLTYVDCKGLCQVRCGAHSRPNVCNRACGTCCARCNCVPPGTYGNREACGKCYTDMTTHGNRLKCP